ncbi:hypothetical protein BUALT_Bualt06G0028800 [Buddleja alternifolia]|uniref:DUF4283 domain-containing protein n=1 Tax=Buddleja alternifolia TaxID=168488 RepID=A0AAV6XND1_9LAMI|nr:hypothetical protein BUALT_Bualt06G0028800 [Buddleja alternifolia]
MAEPDPSRPLSFAGVVAAGMKLQNPGPISKSFEGFEKAALGTKSTFKGRRAVFFSPVEVNQLAHSLRFALIGKVPHGAPSMLRLRKCFDRLSLKGSCTVGALDAVNVLIKLTIEEDFSRIWLKHIWSFDNFPMRVLKWTPEFCPDEEPPVAPVWVNFPGLPAHFFDKKGLYTIAELIGRPLWVDESTISGLRPNVARACIEINLLEERVFEIWIGYGTHGILQKVVYEDPPIFCTCCKTLGHEHSTCHLSGKKPQITPSETLFQPQEDLREVLKRKNGKNVEGSPAPAKNSENVDGEGTSKMCDKPNPKLVSPLVANNAHSNIATLPDTAKTCKRNGKTRHSIHMVKASQQIAKTSNYNRFQNLVSDSESEEVEESDLNVETGQGNSVRHDDGNEESNYGGTSQQGNDVNDADDINDELDSSETEEENTDLNCPEDTDTLGDGYSAHGTRVHVANFTDKGNSSLASQESFHTLKENKKKYKQLLLFCKKKAVKD